MMTPRMVMTVGVNTPEKGPNLVGDEATGNALRESCGRMKGGMNIVLSQIIRYLQGKTMLSWA